MLTRRRFVAAAATLYLLLGAAVSLHFTSSCLLASTKSFRAKQAADLVAEALHGEIYGETAQREKLLEEASRLAPDFGPAMWHRGYVKLDGRWIKADELAPPDSSRQLQNYEAIRARTPATAAAQMRLADWCRQNGLRQQERAHLSQVLDLDPGNVNVMVRLGFRKVYDRWMSADDINRTTSETELWRANLAKWRPEVTAIRQGLRHRSLVRQKAAIARLGNIHSADAIAALEHLLLSDNPALAQHAVSTLDRISDYRAAAAIARIAVSSPWQEIRVAAANRLKAREEEQYIPLLLGELHSPVTARTLATPGNRGGLRLVQTLQREGQHENEQLVLSARNSRGVSAGDVRLQNLQTGHMNQRIADALNVATDQSLPADPQTWWNWWNDRNEVFVQGSKPIRVRGDSDRPIVQLARVDLSRELRDLQRLRSRQQQREIQNRQQQTMAERPQRRSDCLIAGTLIWTSTGAKAVEQMQVGDLVLSQDVESGELAFKPVVRTTVRPTTTLVRIFAGTEVIQASGGHPFWISGEGWVKARDLRPGMELHTINGTICVREIEDGQQVQSFNLIVDDFHSYFVGAAKVLSHDNTVRRATNATVPGLLSQ